MDSTTGTLLILLTGVLVVVMSVLLFRLHAFLALLLAAIAVAALTPHATRERHAIESRKIDVREVHEGGLWVATGNPQGVVGLPPEERDVGVRPGDRYVLLTINNISGRYEHTGDLFVEDLQPNAQGTSELARLTSSEGDTAEFAGSGAVILREHDLAAARKQSRETIGDRIAKGFGSTAGSIGILIAMAAIIGKCLLDSGSADRVVRTMLGWFGEAGAPLAFLISGFALGIPVFFDTVFYLMIPLGKAMRLRTGRNYLLYVLTIVSGATMAHSLVPPTPGPLFVAEELGVGLGTMILAGGVVGLVSASSGWAYAVFVSRRWDLPLRDSEDFSLASVEKSMVVSEEELPPFWLAILPVLLPVILIAGLTVMERTPAWGSLSAETKTLLETLGDKNIALTIAAAVAIGTLMYQRRQRLRDLSDSLQRALGSGGVIILITAAGGAFGSALRQTNVAALFENLEHSSPAAICTLAFLITTAVRTAQGSATVAMMTAVSILSGLGDSASLGFDPVYLALAIGCGSKPVSWMNDSGFWVITRMSGMTEAEGLKFVSPMTTFMGVAGLLVVLAGVTLFPKLPFAN